MTLANPEVNGFGNDTDLFISAPLDTPSTQQDRYGDEFSNPPSKSPLQLKKPSNVETKVELNEDLTGYTIYEKVGDMDYRPVTEMSFQEFAEWKREDMINEYWNTKTDSLDERKDEDIKPPLWQIKRKGDPLIEIRPSGYVTLDFGARFQTTENPAIPVNQQRTGGFDFDQQISLNLSGKIGDRVLVEANWDTKAAFDFDNTIKVTFQGKDTDILREISAGNVSMPLKNSLIRGGQNLFGVKTKLQFGRLTVTALLSNQRGKTETITVRNGAQFREYKLNASDYEEQRHFFLSHEFRDRFADAYERNAQSPNTGIKITRVEVYRTNIQAKAENQRNVLALTDLGETSVLQDDNGFLNITGPVGVPSNQSNDLLDIVKADTMFRDADEVVRVLSTQGLTSGSSYEKINGAIRLTEREYTFHPDLGYISLNSKLRDNEALAVAYEYTLDGQNYKVGEMMEDYQTLDDGSVIILKLLKPQSINIGLNTWDLMMKNIYSLPTSNVSPDNFQLRVIYRDDLTGIDAPTLQEGDGIAGRQLVEVFGLDKINPNGTQFPDGNFDFLENATINTKKGKIIFPHPEPYGEYLQGLFGNQFNLQGKYVYGDLYSQTKDIAKRNTAKDKFAITGFYQSSASADIMLPGINISEGSVVVTVGSITLSEGSDYTVDYRLGRVKINNEAILSSGKDIKVSYEKADAFSFRQKSLLGARFDYAINEKFNIGATVMHMSERPLISRVNIGDEPIKNTQIGLDVAYQDESRIITKLVDKLPVIQTKETSNVSLNWEGAMLKPGTSSLTGNGGTSYVDDFEGAESPISLDQSIKTTWMISSTPATSLYYDDATETDVDYTAHRAKFVAYSLRDLYNFDEGTVKDRFNLTDDQIAPLFGSEDVALNPYVQRISPLDIFPDQELTPAQRTQPQQTIDFAYFPDRRGPYNYNVDASEVAADGTFINPERNWGGVTRAITTDNDFQSRNIQFLEFWMMDPFLTTGANNEPAVKEVLPAQYQADNFDILDMGGDMYFNIGDISEDFMKDGRFAFENGLPENVDTTNYGLVTTEQFLTDAFDVQEERSSQDVGLDGLSDDEEAAFFGITPQDAIQKFNGDVSSDNFTFWDEGGSNTTIIERFMNFNNLEGNSPEDATRSLKTVPDKEDLNRDQNINFTDSYWQFKLPLNRRELDDNNPFVVGKSTSATGVDWYQFRIPINGNTWQSVGGIQGFQNIKFMRVFFTNFRKPIVVRLSQFQFVASQWLIADDGALNERELYNPERPADPNFTVGAVSLFENSAPTENSSPYVLPPDVIQDFDQTSNAGNRQNEQSLRLCVDQLVDGEARAVFKTISTPPLLNYGKLKMFVHAESQDAATQNGEVTTFIRLGTDQFNNYYEVEVPMTFSDIGSDNPFEVWRAENEFDIDLDDIVQVKVNRNTATGDYTQRYSETVGKYKVTVLGTPELSDIRNWMIGVRNPKDDGVSKNFCIWTNELRVTDFDQSVGYATTGSFSTNLADLGTFKATTKITTVGYGDIESKVFEREQANTVQWGVESNLQMDKFIPAKTGIKLPLYVSYDKTTITPKYDPLNGDVEMDKSINSITDDEAREDYENKVKYKATVRSIQLQNVRKEKVKPDAKKHIYDIENFTFGAGYTETKKSGMGGNDGFGNNLQSYLKQEYNGSAAWAYSPKTKSLEPFKKTKALKGKYLGLIRDINFNPIPNSFSMRGELRRTYSQTTFYVNPRIDNATLAPVYKKNFTFDRNYNMRWNITKSINFTYSSMANALIDEPNGSKDGDETITRQAYRDSVWTNLKKFGRLNNFQQDMTLTYKIPLNKIPFLDWVTADVSYKTGYNWRASILGLSDNSEDDHLFGNFISNTRNISFNSKLSLSRLYNKNKFLKSINSPSKRKKKKVPVRAKKEGEEEDEDEKPKRELKGFKAGIRALMLIRDVNGKYTLTHATGIPGFLPTPTFLGMDNSANNAPGSAFILGSQDLDAYKELAVNNNWYSQSEFLNDPITQTRTESIDLRSTIEPFKGFRIQLSAKYKETSNYSEIFRQNGNGYQSFNPVVSGNVNMSYVFIKTSFSGEDGDGFSEIFRQFENNRYDVQNRLQNEVTSSGSYTPNSQDVLIPSFRAAYAGDDNPSLDLAPKIPLPNWRVNYAGLSKLKFIKKKFSSFTVTHGYTGSYDIGGYTSSLEYSDLRPGDRINQRRSDLDTNDLGSYISPFVISGVTIQEKFSPLIGFNIRTKSRVNIRINYNVSRILDLDMANLQVTEENSKDFVIGLGYTKRGMKLPIGKKKGEQKVLKNNLTFKMDLSIRDTRTVQRKVEGDQVVTAGNINFQLRPNISYELNKRVNLQFFYERTVNEPRISSSFKRSTTAFGIKLRFSLT